MGLSSFKEIEQKGFGQKCIAPRCWPRTKMFLTKSIWLNVYRTWYHLANSYWTKMFWASQYRYQTKWFWIIEVLFFFHFHALLVFQPKGPFINTPSSILVCHNFFDLLSQYIWNLFDPLPMCRKLFDLPFNITKLFDSLLIVKTFTSDVIVVHKSILAIALDSWDKPRDSVDPAVDVRRSKSTGNERGNLLARQLQLKASMKSSKKVTKAIKVI